MPVTTRSEERASANRALRAQRRTLQRAQVATSTTRRTGNFESVAASGETAASAASSTSTVSLPLRDAAAVVSSERPRPSAKRKADTDHTDHNPSSKKMRTESSAQRYNLRSTRARARHAATITPKAAAARHINFDESSSCASVLADWNDQDDNDTKLPSGVLDIYSKSAGKATCSCRFDISFFNDTLMATQHLLDYGREYTESLHSSERKQVEEIYGKAALLLGGGDDDASDNGLSYRPRPLPPTALALERTTDMLPHQPFINTKMRSVLVNWMIELGSEYHISSHAFHLSVTLLDAILARGPTREQFQHYSRVSHEESDEDESFDWEIVHRSEFQALGWYVERL